ncbi:energy transducer TonB [Glaciecola sp. SC05]|uniref:energy transducer TonB n=1 Tax=Glaciecola sp. SC05 TaxID=1987355 RepID=UPI0035299B68
MLKIFTPNNTAAIIFTIACLGLSAGTTAQQIPEESMLPCDEVEKAALEQATPDEIRRITAFTPAEIVERKNPTYPRTAAMRSREGWVKVSYVIDEEGKVQDPVVYDHAGDSAFKRAAMSAIKGWEFKPAMKDGKPTQQCHQAVRIDFTMGDVSGASRRFVSTYKKATAFFEQGDIEQTEQLLEKLKADDDRNRYENAWLWRLDSLVARKLEDLPREQRSINRTISSAASHNVRNQTFDKDTLGYMYQRLFAVQVNRGLYAEALQTVDKIENLSNGEKLMVPIQLTVEKVKDFIASDANLFVDGQINKGSNFFHTLARNQFTFFEIKGQLDTVEVRCETHREKFTVAEDFVWSIPESWGQCQVLVQGDSGTRFSLVELNQA